MRKKALRNPGTPFKLPAFILAALLLTALLCLAACGPGSASTAAPETTAEQTEPASTVPSTTEVSASTVPSTTAPSGPLSFVDWVKASDGISDYRGEGEPDASLGSADETYTDLGTLDVFLRGKKGWSKYGSLKSEGFCLIRFETAYGTPPEPVITRQSSLLSEPAAESVPGKHFEGWYGDAAVGRWSFAEDTVKKSMTLTAAYTDEAVLSRQVSKLTNQDIGRTDCPTTGTIPVVVVFIGFTDGLPCDREQFERFFTGEYDPADPLGSHRGYFEHNSYGNVSFDYYFLYYDTGLTCKQAYDNTPRDLEIFSEARKLYKGDQKVWDSDHDGYVDMVVFIFGEDTAKTVGGGARRFIRGNASSTASTDPDYDVPALRNSLHDDYQTMLTAAAPGRDVTGLRLVLHETGHQFGLTDYYNPKEAEGEDGDFDTLGYFDMQSSDLGDWNPYSRFSCGWLAPYIVDDSVESITLKLGCSSEVPDTVLIPTSGGWNGTAFDEYIMVDVMAPSGANGFDWISLSSGGGIASNDTHRGGGVRIYHVDSRMMQYRMYGNYQHEAIDSYEDYLSRIQNPDFGYEFDIYYRFLNSNAFEPLIPGESRFYHLIDVVPSDGSRRFRTYSQTNTRWLSDFFQVTDLFTVGDVFSMETCSDAFANAPYMNNGSSLDYEVRVDFYDPKAQEAIITISKIK